MAATDPPNVGRTTSPQSLLPITQVQDLVESQLSEGIESSWIRPLIFRGGCLVRPDEGPPSVNFKQENLVDYTNCRVDMEEESRDDFSILGIKDKGVHDAEFDKDSDNDDLDDNEQDGNAHSQQLQAFLQKAADVESFKPRLTLLKAAMDELLSVIEGSDRPQDLVEEALEMMREFIANVCAECHEQNTGKKRSAIVSYNQEREPKKCRQLVANHGIR
jgi:hypothetical protein